MLPSALSVHVIVKVTDAVLNLGSVSTTRSFGQLVNSGGVTSGMRYDKFKLVNDSINE